ncbi:MAG TPA: hypothetical protein PLU49_11080 [Saprospiraceae bacterium]|nr:hypothetical protein [Saprospiraceae bacterium]
MKNLYFVLFLLSFGFISNSCVDKCKNVNCNQGICVEGTCNCYPGYSGEFCDIKLTSNFTADWAGSFACEGLAREATIKIVDFESDIKRLQLNTVGMTIEFQTVVLSLDDKPLNAYCTDDYKGFDIPAQNVVFPPFVPGLPGISATITGTGVLIDPTHLNVSIKVENTDFGVTFNCTGVFSK